MNCHWQFRWKLYQISRPKYFVTGTSLLRNLDWNCSARIYRVAGVRGPCGGVVGGVWQEGHASCALNLTRVEPQLAGRWIAQLLLGEASNSTFSHIIKLRHTYSVYLLYYITVYCKQYNCTQSTRQSLRLCGTHEKLRFDWHYISCLNHSVTAL